MSANTCTHLNRRLATLREAANGSVLLGISGKDSLTVLDLLLRAGITARPFHLYIVPGLEVRERFLRQLECRYALEIIRWPHPDLSAQMRWGTYRYAVEDFPKLSFNDVYDALRAETGIEWLATGEKMTDSLQRRGQMKRWAPTFLEPKRRVAWPIADWNDRQVRAYLRQRRIQLPPEYPKVGRGWGGHPLEYKAVRWLAEKHPKDFARYKKWFPAVEAALYHEKAR